MSALALPALALPLLLAGCAHGPRPLALSAPERALLASAGELAIVTRGSPGAAILRARARELPDDPELDLRRLAARMERAMRRAAGVGVAGPQVGLGLRVAVLLLDYRGPRPYAIFVRNPVIVARADETMPSYEGCLSVPGVGGLVLRQRWVSVRWRGLEGAAREATFDGPNAILWQHELDHLDGVLYLDRLQGPLLSTAEMRRRRRALEAAGSSRSRPASRPR